MLILKRLRTLQLRSLPFAVVGRTMEGEVIVKRFAQDASQSKGQTERGGASPFLRVIVLDKPIPSRTSDVLELCAPLTVLLGHQASTRQLDSRELLSQILGR